MLTFKLTQDSKPFVKDSRGTEIVDFIHKDFVTTGGGSQALVIDYFIAGSDDAMRIDVITQKMYGYLDNIEQVLKFNEITNPFAIEEGDFFYTYDVPSMNSNMRPINSGATTREDVRDQYITPEKKSNVDPALRDFDKRNSPRKADPSGGNKPALPPNYAAFGDTELQIRNGKIVFGPNVTRIDEDCDKPLSKSEFISRLIKNRLKK